MGQTLKPLIDRRHRNRRETVPVDADVEHVSVGAMISVVRVPMDKQEALVDGTGLDASFR